MRQIMAAISLVLIGGAARADQVVALALGDEHSCSLSRSGAVACWGRNTWGQLGDGTRVDHTKPATVVAVDHAAQLATYGARSCATLRDGRVACWGHLGGLIARTPGEAMLPPEAQDALLPRFLDGLDHVAEIALGGEHACARHLDGTVRCWGKNGHGELGLGTRTATAVPTEVPGLRGVRALALGTAHSCALLEDHTVSCWGANEGGQVGHATLEDRLRPTGIDGLTGITGLGASGGSTCAQVQNGTTRCWGWNNDGQLGDGTLQNHAVPRAVKDLEGTVEVALFAGGACARHANGTVHCWGEGARTPSLYDDSRRSLLPIEQAALLHVTALPRAGQHTAGHRCVIAGEGAVRCWGPNDHGQLGALSSDEQPTRVSLPPSPRTEAHNDRQQAVRALR